MATINIEFCNEVAGGTVTIDYDDVTHLLSNEVVGAPCIDPIPDILYQHVDGNTLFQVVFLAVSPWAQVISQDLCDLAFTEVVVNSTGPAEPDGSITVNETGGTGPFEYSKDGGTIYQGSNVFSNLTPGIYLVKVRDSSTPTQCFSGKNVTVASSVACTVDITDNSHFALDHETVWGAADGIITVVSVTGGVGPFEYKLSTNDTYQPSNQFSNLTPATYMVTVRDSLGCESAWLVRILVGDKAFGRVTKKHRVLVDDQCYDSPVYLGWDNGIGGFDFWLFKSNQEIKLRAKDNGDYEQPFLEMEGLQTKEVSLGMEGTERIRVFAAGVTSDEYLAIRHVLTSSRVYKYEQDGDRKQVLVIPNTQIHNTADQLHEVSFEVQLPTIFTT